MRWLLLCLLLLLPAGLAAQSDDSDRGFIQGLLEGALSGPGREVRIEGFAGALSSRATIERITVADRNGVWLTISDVAMVWTRSALLRGEIEIDEISVGLVELPRPPLPAEGELPAPEASGSFSLPDLPVAIRIAQMQVARVDLGPPVLGEAAALSINGSAALAGGSASAQISVNRLDAGGEVNLNASYDDDTTNILLDLQVQEPEGGLAVNLLGIPDRPSLQLSIAGEGTLDDFTSDIRLVTDGEERLAGSVSLRGVDDGARRFAVDLGGDLAPMLAPDYQTFLGPDVQLTAEAAQRPDGTLTLELLDLRAAALELRATAEIAPDGWPHLLSLDGTIEPPQGDRILLPLSGPQTYVESVRLTGSFDSSEGNGWQIEGRAEGVERDAARLDTVGFAGSGVIDRDTDRVSGRLELDAGGIDPGDAALATAIGDTLRGVLSFDWSRETPLTLTDMELGGSDYSLTGDITVSGIDGTGDLTVAPDLTVTAQDLARFGPLTGLQLGGVASLAVSGSAEPLTGVIDLTLSGTTNDITTGIAQVDPLLAGEGTLSLGLVRDESGLRVDPLQVRTAEARIEGSARVSTGDSDVNVEAEIVDVARILPALDGAVNLSLQADQTGNVWQINADAALPGDASLQFRGSVAGDGDTEMTANGQLDGEIGRLAAFSGLAGRDISGRVTLGAEGSADLLDGSFTATARGETTQLAFDVPMVEPLFRGTTRFDLEAERDADGVLQLSQLDLTGPGLTASASGRLDAGESDVRLNAAIPELELILPDLPGAAQLTVTADQTDDAWAIEALAQLPGNAQVSYIGTVTGDGQTSLDIAGRAEAEIARLAPFSDLAGRPLSGGVAVDVEGSADALAGSFDLSASGETRSPTFGQPMVEPLLRGTTEFAVTARRDADGVLEVNDLDVNGPGLTASGTGRLDPGSSTARLSASLPNIALALPQLPGAAQLTVEAQQSDETWAIDALAQLPGDARVTYDGTITGDGQSALEVGGRIEAEIAQLAAYAGLAGRRLSGGVSLTAEGTADVLAGSFEIDANGETRSLAFEQPTIEPLLRGTSTFEVSAERDADGSLRIETVSLEGPALDAELSGSYASDEAALDFRASVSNLGLVVPELPGAASVEGSARHDGGPWQINVTGNGPGGITLRSSGTVAQDVSRVDVSLNGSVPLALANAQLSGQSLSGILRFDLAVDGPPALDSVTGRIGLENARFALPAQGIAINDIGGQVNLSGGRAQVGINGTIASGGQVRVSGPITLSPPFSANITAELVNATIRDRELFEANLNGRVTVEGPLTGGARIGGQITLGTVEVRIPNIGPSYAALDGLRHASPPADVQRTLQFAGLADTGEDSGEGSGPAYPLDLTISAPNRLFVRGRGLDAELGGELRLTGTTNDVVPIGQFDLIRGRIDLLGNRLSLDEGSVRIRGSFDPVLRFLARSEVDGTDVILLLEGEASSPELTVTSSPELPQDEALSLLLFGRDATSISPLQAVQLAAAIRTLSGRGGLGIQRLREGLGVDEFDIGTDADGNAEARIGKYISDTVYTDVVVNGDGDSEINLNLDVSENITARGRVGSDGDTAIGIFYERDY